MQWVVVVRLSVGFFRGRFIETNKNSIQDSREETLEIQ